MLTKANWRKFDSFCWHDRPENADEFALVYTHNRDSGLIDQSNAHVIGEALAPFIDSGDVIPEHHGHFACGWVDGFAIRCGSDAERVYLELRDAMDDYPILDESHLGELEQEAQSEAWENWARSEFTRGLENAFGYDLTADDGELFELFQKLCDSSNTYWTEDYIDIKRIVESAELDDIAEFVPVQGLKVFRHGAWFANGSYHCGNVSGPSNYWAEFELIAQAIADGESFAGPFTWELGS